MRAEYGSDDQWAVSPDRDSSPASADLVGREREQAALRGAYERARAGQGRLVLISGEAGIGKTSLVQSFLSEVDEHEVIVLTGGCYDLSTTPPYGPWNELARSYRTPQGLPSFPGFMAESKTQSGPNSQAALFSRALGFIVEVANHQTLVIVLEDLHWSDQSSLDLLRFVARSIRDHTVLLVGTYRDAEITHQDPLYLTIPQLVRESQATRIELRRLAVDEVHTLIQRLYSLDTSDSDVLVEYLGARAEGNPLFIHEVLRDLEFQGILQHENGHWFLHSLDGSAVPDLIQQMVEGRLAGFSERTRTAIRIGAVIGQVVPLELWEHITGEDIVASAAEEALESQFVTEVSGGLSIAFRHALVRQAVYESLTLPRRRRFHRQVADVLIERTRPNASMVAHHLQQAGDPRAAEWLILAGEDAEGQYAWKEAFSLYSRGLDALRERPGNERQVSGLLLKTARLLRYFDPERGNEYLEAARQAAVNCGDDEIAALALFNMGNNLCVLEDARRGLRLMRESVEALAAALVDATPDDIARLIRWSGTAVAAQDHPLKRIHGTLVLLLAAFGRYREAISIAERYLEVDWRTATTEDQYSSVANATKFNADGYKGLGIALSALGRPEEAKLAFDLAQEILQLVHYIPYRLLVGSMELILLHFPYRTTNLRERTELVQLIKETIQPSSGMTDAGNSLWGYEYYLFQEGRWDELRLTIQTNDLPTNSYYRSTCLSVRARLAWAEGHTDHAWKLIHRILPNGVDTEFDEQAHSIALETQRLAAELAREAGDNELAREWMTILDGWLDWNGAVLGRANGMLIWARIDFDEGDSEKAVSVARKALEQASDPEQPLALIGIHRFLGELALHSEDLDSAGTHLWISLELAEVCRIPFERALTLISLAELHTARDDQDEALNLLKKAQGICTELGARPTLDRAERLAASLARTHEETPFGLTSREIDVLYLLVQGMTDREIAKRLFISHRTVMRHVSHILQKLNVESRTAAAAHAVREDLV